MPAKPRGFLRLVGPGVVLVGLAIGAGELIIWPVTTARFGATVAWAAVLGVSLQLVINLEVGRYTLATGESVYAGFARVGRAWVPVFLALNVLGWLLPGWARICAGAVKALVVGPAGPGEPWAWTALTFVVVAAVMFGPRHVYRTIERTTVCLVVVMLIGLVIIAVKVATPESVAELARGVVSIGSIPEGLPLYVLFSAIVFAGAGGTTNLMLSYYLLDKGWGMAAGAGYHRGRAYRVMESDENNGRWRAWLRHLRNDQMIFFWALNTLIILLFILSALAVLHAEGIIPSQEMLVLEEAAILERIWGRPGALLFLVVGIACLFSTQLTLLDGVSRSLADLLSTNYLWARRRGPKTCYRWVAVSWMIAGTALTWAWSSLPPFVFLLSAGFFGGIAMACYCPLLLRTNTVLLPEACRPSLPSRMLLGAVSVFYITFALASLWVVAGRLTA